MAIYRKSGGKALSGRKPKSAYRKRPAGVKGLVAKMVKVQLHKAIENKEASHTFPMTAFNSSASVIGDVIRITPDIRRGTSGGERTGDQITARYFNLQGHITVNESVNDVPRSNLLVRIMIVIPKQYPTQYIAGAQIANWLPYVLKQGANGVALDGSIQSMYLKPNYDVVTVLAERKIYLKSSVLYGTGTDRVSVNWGAKLFNISLKVKNKIMKYSDSQTLATDTSTTFAPSLILGCCFMDGSSPTLLTTPINMGFTSTLSYEDA